MQFFRQKNGRQAVLKMSVKLTAGIPCMPREMENMLLLVRWFILFLSKSFSISLYIQVKNTRYIQ